MPETSHHPKVFLATPFESRMAKRGTRFPEIAEMLHDAGYDVEYITTNFSHAYKAHFPQEDIERSRSLVPYSLTVLKIPGYTANISVRRVICNLLMALKYLFYLGRKACRGDVLVIPSRPVELILAAACVKRLRRTAVVLDIRDIWPDALVGVSGFRKYIFRAYCSLFLRPSLRRIDRFVHIAPSFVPWLHRYVPNARSLFIPPGFSATRFSHVPPPPCRVRESISLVFVGALQHQLDIRPVLEALVFRRHYTLTIIGDDGHSARSREIGLLIAEHSMANVCLTGRLEPAAVVEHLTRCDIGVVPMIAPYAMPNKLFDYIGAYLPVLALGDNDTTRLVSQYDIGWTVPFDKHRVGRLLDRLTHDEIIGKTRNVLALRDRFDRRLLYQSFLSLVSQLLAATPSNRIQIPL